MCTTLDPFYSPTSCLHPSPVPGPISTESSFMSIFIRCAQRCNECCCQVPLDLKAGRSKHGSVPSSSSCTRLASCSFWLFYQVKMNMKSQCFELIQNTEECMVVQPKTPKREAVQIYFRKQQVL